MKGKADKIHEKRPGLSGKRIFPMGEGGGDKDPIVLQHPADLG